MLLRASDEEVIKMGQLAVMASSPMGMGHLHFDPSLKPEDIILPQTDEPFQRPFSKGLFIDYYQGRMVKFTGWRRPDGMWEFHDKISGDYQSWIHQYPSYLHLLEAVRK